MTWWRAAAGGLLLLGAVGLTIRGLSDRPAPSVEAQTTRVKRGSLTRVVTGAGKVQAATTVKISSNLSGDLTELLVKVGDVVSKGQVLGRIDQRRFDAAAKQAQAGQSGARSDLQATQVELDRATAEYGRMEVLAKKDLTSAAELDQARAARDAAAARLGSARERLAQASAASDEASHQLGQTTLRSPINGTVIETSRQVGERVRGSDFSEDVVMTLAALNAMEVRVEIGEHEVVHLALGQKAQVIVDAIEEQTFDGVVTEIARNALIKNPGTEAEVTTFPVKVTLAAPPPEVLPGMSAEVRIATQTRTATLVVPMQAVTVRPERSLPGARPAVERDVPLPAVRAEALAKVVFVVDGQRKAHPRKVKTGISSEAELEILDGLQEGDEIVEGPYRVLARELKDGDQVRPPEAGGESASRL